MKTLLLALALALTVSQTYAATSKVQFLKPLNNSEVSQTFEVEFSVADMTLEKAGVMKKGTGHHHLIVDGKPIKKGIIVPKDETHIHFGDASSKTNLTLAPGKHTLTLQFADGSHISLGPDYSTTIDITVK